MALIFDIHGQHNHESLLRKESQRRYLDRFAGLEEETAQFNRVFLELAEQKKTLDHSLGSEREKEERLEILTYAVEEIDKSAPRSGESRELESEAQRLGDFERLAEQVNSAAAFFYDGETSALSLCRRARSALVCGPWGAEDVEFLISANTGEPLKDLARIASGGELSRVMLAIKTVLAGANAAGNDASPETLVVDEIDTGIGGEVALAVGEYLVKIGGLKQIFCVTHLASIAVRADNHLRVEKKVVAGGPTGGERTLTQVSALGGEDRRQEIARMLAGDAGKAALAHADALLSKYGKGT
jgi:DNA repair protein RecN (Recombination protein N)